MEAWVGGCPDLPKWVARGARGRNWLDRSPPVWFSSRCPTPPSSEARSPASLPVPGRSWPLRGLVSHRSGDGSLQPGLTPHQPCLWSPSVAFLIFPCPGAPGNGAPTAPWRPPAAWGGGCCSEGFPEPGLRMRKIKGHFFTHDLGSSCVGFPWEVCSECWPPGLHPRPRER